MFGLRAVALGEVQHTSLIPEPANSFPSYMHLEKSARGVLPCTPHPRTDVTRTTNERDASPSPQTSPCLQNSPKLDNAHFGALQLRRHLSLDTPMTNAQPPHLNLPLTVLICIFVLQNGMEDLRKSVCNFRNHT